MYKRQGVINDIPYRLGALVSPSIATPMTTVSEIEEVYVYFSMTEKELLAMTKTGGTIKEEIEKIPSIRLQLIDGTESVSYTHLDVYKRQGWNLRYP